MSGRPNVVLVVIDTARADHFGPYGGRARTPAFDELADAGVLVRGARASAPWTVPSHGTIFSGLLPDEHRVDGRAARSSERRLTSLGPVIERNADRWLPEVFRRAGYDTAAISANVWITREMGFDLGFDSFTQVGLAAIAPRGAAPRGRLRDRVPRAALDRGKHALRYGAELLRGRDFGAEAALGVARKLASAARKSGTRPFFWFLNVMEAHAPYLPPSAYLPSWGPDRLIAPSVVHRYLEERSVLSYNVGRGTLPSRAERVLRRLYAGEISYADAFVGELVDVLRPMLDETLLVVTSDHGEHLGEFHRLGHQLALDAALLDVPLVLRGPGQETARAGAVFSLRGLPAVIAGAVGLRSHPWEPPPDVAISRYESGWEQVRRAPDLASALRLTDAERTLLRSPMAGATDGRTTLTVSDAGEQLDGDPAGADRLRSALNLEEARAATSRAAADDEGLPPQEEAEIEARLRELGYL
jgi:arylsulfatase A-like enzyme